MKKILKYITPIVIMTIMTQQSIAQVHISVTIAPPPLPVYTQPYCPGDGYVWIPGYWAYDDEDGYYWVPGEWVFPPEVGFYWTPGYWAFVGGDYVWNAGYWGPEVGFYGGIDYGCGYFGSGYVGGRWRDGVFRYNTAVTRVDPHYVHHTYVNRSVVRNTAFVHGRESFNGRGGVHALPTPHDRAIAGEHHIHATSAQLVRQRSARSDKSQFASVNHGHPEHLFVERNSHGSPGGNHGHNQAMVNNNRTLRQDMSKHAQHHANNRNGQVNAINENGRAQQAQQNRMLQQRQKHQGTQDRQGMQRMTARRQVLQQHQMPMNKANGRESHRQQAMHMNNQRMHNVPQRQVVQRSNQIHNRASRMEVREPQYAARGHEEGRGRKK